MNKLNTIIAEDEAPARRELNFLLTKIDGVEVVGEAENGRQAEKLIKDIQPQLVFLDIQMPGQTGLEVAEEIKKLENPPIIVFITAYDEYALEAFEVNAVDYILKPFAAEELKTTVERVIKMYEAPAEQNMEAKLSSLLVEMQDNNPTTGQVDKLPVCGDRGRIKLLSYSEILAAYTRSKKVYVKTYSSEYKVDFNLTELENELPADKFLRIHRSYLVNLSEIKEVIPWFKGKYQVVINDDQEQKLPVSRRKVEQIKEIFHL